MTRRTPSGGPLRIAMIGTRGVPAAYGGFETAIEEIGQRMVHSGHAVTVYCRNAADKRDHHLGMKLVHLGALRGKAVETLSHTALSVGHVLTHAKPDVAFVFNAANAPFVPALRLRGVPTAVHVDGLEWKRDKWGGNAKRYYRFAEQLSVRHADALIADAEGIAEYYRSEFDVPTTLLSYGAKILDDGASHRLAELGLSPGGYHLVVARFEPENHVDVIVEGYHTSDASLPLIVVGSAPYAARYTDRVTEVAASDPRIRLLGGIWDQELLDQLYANSHQYIHGHSVGGTNPSLLRAMGAGAAVLAFDVSFNREVLGTAGRYFSTAHAVRRLVEHSEADRQAAMATGRLLRLRAIDRYDWDTVAAGYEELAFRLAAGYSTHGVGHIRQHRTTARPGFLGTRTHQTSTPEPN